MNSEVVRLVDISHTAPDLPLPLVRRPHLIRTLTQIFESNVDVVCIEAPSGYGKTTLQLEFADTISPPCFGTFIKSHSRTSYDPTLIRSDLANQVQWYLTATTLSDTSEPTDGDLRRLWSRCARKLNRQGTPGYVLVDGMHEIPDSETSIKLAILDLIPFGLRPFRFLFTGTVDEVLGRQAIKLRVKPYTLSPFNSHETGEYLQDLVEDKETRIEFHAAFDGVPSLLASVRRQIADAADPKAAVDLASAVDIDSLFEAEWKRVDSLPKDILTALGYVIAYNRPVSTARLSTHSSIGAPELDRAFEEMPFMAFSKKNNGWEFSSDSFREFSERKLRDIVKSAMGNLVSELLENPDSDSSLTQLPSYLDRVGSTDILLEWLDHTRLAAILRKQRTAAGIEPTLRKAITICLNAKNDRALTAYSLCRSVIRQISQTTGIDHEIRARSALGDTDGALAVANDVPLLTQRLRLLAVAADALSHSPGVRLSEIVAEIHDLAHRVDVSQLSSDEVIDIATDVYPIDAQLAISLLRKTTQGDVDDSSLEVAIARVSLSALRSKLSTESERGGEVHQSIPFDLVGDEKLRKLLEASTAFYRVKDAAELLEFTRTIEDASERLFIQRKWISHHSLREDVIDVIEVTIGDAIAESQFTANATFYREVSAPLPLCVQSDRRKTIVGIVEGQESVIRRKGPTVDFVRLQLILAECDCADRELNRATERLEALYLDTVGLVEELETKITCLAWFSADLSKFAALRGLPDFLQLREVIEGEVEDTLDEILRDGADQFAILSDALRAFAKRVPRKAMEIAKRLNTVERRNMARFRVIRAMSQSRSQLPAVETLFAIFDDFEVGADFDSSLHEISKRICEEISKGAIPKSTLVELFGRVDKCQSSVTKLKILAELAATVEIDGNYDGLRTRIHEGFLEQFSAIMSPRAKYSVACELIAKLKASVPSLAQILFEFLTSSDRRTAISEDVERGSYYILDLMVKAISALARCKLLSENDVERTCSVIGKIEDPYRKVTLFGRLAFFFWKEGESRYFSEIVNKNIWPVLSSLDGQDQRIRYRCWRNGYPVVWLEDSERARHATSSFPESARNECTVAVCFALLRAQPPGEPFDDDSRKGKANFDYSDIQRLLRLCEETNEDNVIFVVFDWIAREVSAQHVGVRTTRDQKAEISLLHRT